MKYIRTYQYSHSGCVSWKHYPVSNLIYRDIRRALRLVKLQILLCSLSDEPKNVRLVNFFLTKM